MKHKKQDIEYLDTLFESDLTFRMLFKNSPDPTWIINEQNLFVLSNKAAARTLGYDSVEALQATHPSKLSPEFQPDGKSSLEKANEMMATAHREGVHRFEWVHTRRNGENFPVEVTLSELIIDSRHYLYCSWNDITERKKAEDALKHSERHFKHLIKSSPAVIYSTRASGDYGATFISENVKQLLGYEPHDFIDDPYFWMNHIHPEDKEWVTGELSILFEQDYYKHEYRFLNKMGNYIWMLDEMRLYRDSNGEPEEIIGYWIDISDRKKLEESMRLQSKIAQNIAEGINLVKADDETFAYVNEKYEQMFGYDPGEMLGKHVSIVNAADTRTPEMVSEMVAQSLKDNSYWSGELLNIRKDGSVFWTHSVVSAFEHSEYGHVYLTAQRDISQQKNIEFKLQKLNKELELSSHQDGLTGIANRRMFDLMLSKEWARGLREHKPLALIMFDLDFFKQYNDYYGHVNGDKCLKDIAQKLSREAKRSMDLCARYGGEEFVILLPNTTKNQAVRLAEECREKIIELGIPHESSTISDIVTISAGVSSILPTTAVSFSSLIEDADTALYQAKSNGRNRVESK